MSVQLDSSPAETPRVALTRRSIAIGILTGALLNIYSDYAGLILGSASLVKSQLPMAMLMPFIVWVAINTVLKFIRPAWALRSTEMLVIYSLTWIVGTIPASGWTAYWGGIVSAPLYHESPENGWRDLLFDDLPWWALPYRSETFMRTFYEGLPEGQVIPWGGWFWPLFWWTAVSLALVMAGLCLSAIFQKQWEQAERLTFPLAEFPLELTRGFDDQDRVPAIFRDRLFWFGFFAVFGIFAWNIVGYFHPDLPSITLYYDHNHKQILIARDFPPVIARILPPVIGFTYLCNLDILLSLGVFRGLAILKEGLMNRVGFAVGYAGQQAESGEILTLESHGALVFLSLWAVWAARHHLQRVGRAALAGPCSDEDDGFISYRYAIIGFAASVAFVTGWLCAIGLTLPLAVGHVILTLTAYFTVTKFIALTGFPYFFPIGAKGTAILQTFTGTAGLNNREYIGLGYISSSAFFGNTRIPAWPALPHHLKMFGTAITQRARVFGSVPLTFAVGFLASCCFIIYLGYSYAGQNLGLTGFGGGGNIRTYDGMVTAILDDDKTVFDPAKLAVWGFGFGLAGLLTLAGNRLAWWPIHPIGLAFQTTTGSRVYAFSILLVWGIKLLILRIGGIALYNRAKPFFIGLVVGYVFSITFSAGVDYIWFPDDGHGVHNW